MKNSFITVLQQRLGKNKVSLSEAELYRHSHDESFHTSVEPDVVCFPESIEDVKIIVEIAQVFQKPITPFGAGSGLEGAAIPVQKGISLNFERMNQVLHFSPEDMIITVQPGITRLQLNDEINRYGLYFPIDPGADATIGGMVATNASGTTAVRYGSMRDQVLDLEVVLANNEVIHTGSKAKKSSSGYHLTGIFTGSEGTLGILTEITLKLHGIPEHFLAARCTFNHLEDCVKAANAVKLSGVQVLRMELVDAESIKQVNEYGNYHYPIAHSLFFEFAGAKITIEEEAKLVEQLMIDLNCIHWELASDSKERAKLWKARHEMAYAYRHQKGVAVSGSDVCVPISNLPKLITFVRDLINKSRLKGGILGHVGDGNFHTLIMYNRDNLEEAATVHAINEQIAYKAISFEGTCTGEHGVGLGKMKYQKSEHGYAVEIMKQMKNILDPNGILNPGKIFKK